MSEFAIVGMSCRYPGSLGVSGYWKTILKKRYNLQSMSDTYGVKFLSKEYNFNNAIEPSHSLYTTEYGSIQDISFIDPLRFGIPPSDIEGDPSQFIGTQVAAEAIADYINNRGTINFDENKVGVIVGRGDHPHRGVVAGLMHGIGVEQTLDILTNALKIRISRSQRLLIREYLETRIRPRYQRNFVPNLVSNVMSGTISNRLGLRGPNLLVDAACSSALVALDYSIKLLDAGDCNSMIVGGIQASMNVPIYELFSALNALATNNIAPLSSLANGTLLSEGAGFVVIKRLSDAIIDQDKIYAIIDGLGIASDGRGTGLLAPNSIGQVLAINRAYKKSQLNKKDISLIEAHATGISHGDNTEIKSLNEAFKEVNLTRSIALTSVKSLIGHSIPASGMASLIKLALCMKNKIMLSGKTSEPSASLGDLHSPFYLLKEHSYWESLDEGKERACAMNSFGFGGINGHLILKEYRSDESTQYSIQTKKGGKSVIQKTTDGMLIQQSSRSFDLIYLLFEAEDVRSLVAEIENINIDTISDEQFQTHKIGVKTKIKGYIELNPDSIELETIKIAIDSIKKLANDQRIVQGKNYRFCLVDKDKQPVKIAMIIPGESAINYRSIKEQISHVKILQEWNDLIDSLPGKNYSILNLIRVLESTKKSNTKHQEIEALLRRPDISTQLLAINIFGYTNLLRKINIIPDIFIGHSAGETDAIVLAGLAGKPTKSRIKDILTELHHFFEKSVELNSLTQGNTYAISGVSPDIVQKICNNQTDSHIVSINSDQHCVVFTTQSELFCQDELIKNGAIITPTPLTRPYHTPYFQNAASSYSELYQKLIPDNAKYHDKTTVISCLNSNIYKTDKNDIINTLISQWSHTVDFRMATKAAYKQGARIFIEVGSDSTLTTHAKQTLQKNQDCEFISLGSSKIKSLDHLIRSILKLWLLSENINLVELSSQMARFNDLPTPIFEPKQHTQIKSDLPYIESIDIYDFLLKNKIISRNEGDNSSSYNDDESQANHDEVIKGYQVTMKRLMESLEASTLSFLNSDDLD